MIVDLSLFCGVIGEYDIEFNFLQLESIASGPDDFIGAQNERDGNLFAPLSQRAFSDEL